MLIRKASPRDTSELTELTMQSKAHWGYSPEQMESWREELTITEDYLLKNGVFVLQDGDQVLGYYSFNSLSNDKVNLDNLFVAPEFIGAGLGRKLMIDFLERVTEKDIKVITLYADPNVESFYLKFGFETISQLPSSIPSRTLPVMQLKLP